jgi:hypothetical protein
MKTRDLIARLMEADPSGELECCIHNEDILGVMVQPAYWDGCLQVLTRDPALAGFYDVAGGRFVSAGAKVVITPLGIEDALMDALEMPVEFDSEHVRARYGEHVERWRAEARAIKAEIAATAAG